MQNKKQKWLIVGNWKMNPITSKLAKQIFSSVKKHANKMRNTDTVICPPFVYMENLKATGHRCVIGAQDLFWETEGSFTGSISFLQLKNLGVKYALVGHSERRDDGETNEDISKKIKASLKGMITPVLCIGEKERDAEGAYLINLKEQVVKALQGLPKASIKDIVIAYEPVWAIGKEAKRDATAKEVFEVSIFIKKVLSDIYETKSVPPTRILFGGSVNEKNVLEYLKEGGVDGLLVGRASLDPKKFNEILNKVDGVKRY